MPSIPARKKTLAGVTGVTSLSWSQCVNKAQPGWRKGWGRSGQIIPVNLEMRFDSSSHQHDRNHPPHQSPPQEPPGPCCSHIPSFPIPPCVIPSLLWVILTPGLMSFL